MDDYISRPRTHSEVGRHTFITKRKLKPGDEVDLSQFSKIPPATILDARRGEVPSEKNLISKVTIKRWSMLTIRQRTISSKA